MATHLGEVKFIDLRKSTLDKDRSDPSKGIYKFKKEVIADRGITRNPNYKHKWGVKATGKKWSQDWVTAYDAEYVGINPYIYPKGARLDENQHWTFKDAILERIPLEIYADKVKRDRELSDDQVEAVLRQHQRAQGKNALSKEEVDEILGL